MMKNWRVLLMFSLLLGGATGCSDATIEELDRGTFGYDYYPLEIGRSYIYEVDSIVFREGANQILQDSSRTLVREVIVDTLRDNTGALVYRIERYERPDEQLPWQITKVLTAARNATQALRTEDNLRFIKLVFPLRPGKAWDGNRFLPERVIFNGSSTEVEMFKGWQDYQVEAVGQPDTIAGRFYGEVATIKSESNSEIEWRYAKAKYAKGVGLVYREWRILDTQCVFCCDTLGPKCISLPWEEKIENGFILRQRLRSYE